MSDYKCKMQYKHVTSKLASFVVSSTTVSHAITTPYRFTIKMFTLNNASDNRTNRLMDYRDTDFSNGMPDKSTFDLNYITISKIITTGQGLHLIMHWTIRIMGYIKLLMLTLILDHLLAQ